MNKAKCPISGANTSAKSPWVCLSALACAVALVGCGGGGGDAPVAPAPAPVAPTAQTSALAQGRWVSLTPAYTAILVPASAGLEAHDTLWAVAQDASTLIKVRINGASQAAGTVSGQIYALGSGAVSQIGNASYSLQTSANGVQASLQPVLSATLELTHIDPMSGALTGAQANGRWQASLGSVQVNWSLQDQALSGTSSSGCTYSGQATPVASIGIYRVQLSETCGAATVAMAGIATQDASASRLTVVLTNGNDTQGGALLFARQP